jgi:hypothetical protein
MSRALAKARSYMSSCSLSSGTLTVIVMVSSRLPSFMDTVTSRLLWLVVKGPSFTHGALKLTACFHRYDAQ